MKNLLFTILFIIAFGACAPAQNIGPAAFNAGGGSKAIQGNTYEYAIGSPFNGKTYNASNLVVTPGVLQPYFDNGTGISGMPLSASDITIFPNPASDLLFVQPDFNTPGKLRYVLFDVTGRVISKNEYTLSQGNERQKISMQAFAAGNYVLLIQWRQKDKIYNGSFKIEKTQ